MHISNSSILIVFSGLIITQLKTMHHGSTYQECLLTLADMLQLLIWLSDSKHRQKHLLFALIS